MLLVCVVGFDLRMDTTKTSVSKRLDYVLKIYYVLLIPLSHKGWEGGLLYEKESNLHLEKKFYCKLQKVYI